MTRSMQACFLTADRQCAECPFSDCPGHSSRARAGVTPASPETYRGWVGGVSRCAEGRCKKPIPIVRRSAPLPPIGPHKRPRLADSFLAPWVRRGASPGSLDQRSEEWHRQ